MKQPKLHMALPEHEVAYEDLCNLVGKHAANVSAQTMLAIAANMVGKLIAMQDQRRITPAMAMEVVAANIEMGNQSVMAQLMRTEGNA